MRILCFLLLVSSIIFAQETLPPLSDPIFKGKIPKTLEESWLGFNPTSNPLEVSVLHEWTQDVLKANSSKVNITMKVVKFTVGIFRGQKTTLVGIYGYPTGQTNLPGILQCHGYGQSANRLRVLNTASHGYAVFSMNWGGDPFTVDKNNKWTTPNTNWKGISTAKDVADDHWDEELSLMPTQYTIDNVISPRNNNYFIVTLLGRRALTFLQSRSEVNSEKLGVFGFSLGGALTIFIASTDNRVKAAVSTAAAKVRPVVKPENMEGYDIWVNSISAFSLVKQLSCPIIFHNPSNDFHGIIDDVDQLAGSLTELTKAQYRYTREPNKNHQVNHENDINHLLWFNQHLKESFSMPLTPSVVLKFTGNIPTYEVSVDESSPVRGVQVWKTIESKLTPVNPTKRVWSSLTTKKVGGVYKATLPIVDTLNQTLRVFSNVEYNLPQSVKAGWGYTINYHSVSSGLLTTGKKNNDVLAVTNLEYENTLAYPIPSFNTVFLSKVKEGEFFVLYNIKGLMVLKGEYSKTGINLKNLPKGMYFLKIKHAKYKIIKK